MLTALRMGCALQLPGVPGGPVPMNAAVHLLLQNNTQAWKSCDFSAGRAEMLYAVSECLSSKTSV